MSDLLVVVAEGKAKPGKEEELRSRMRGLIAPTRQETGCVQYDLHESIEEPGRFVFFERWTTKAALDQHLQTPHLTDFAAAAGDLVDGGMSIRLYRKLG